MLLLSLALAASLLLIIILPMTVRWVDEQLGYLILLTGGAMLALSMHLDIVRFAGGSFRQALLPGAHEELHILLLESWVLILCYFVLSLLATLFHRTIARMLWKWMRRMSAPTMIFLWTLVAGSLGSLSVVVMAVIGAIFFGLLQEVTRRDYTPCVVLYSAAIGLSALLSTIGEPLSLFIAKSLGEPSSYLLRTFGGMYAVNIACLSVASWFLAKRATMLPSTTEEQMVESVHSAERSASAEVEDVRKALSSVEAFEEETHDLAHHLDRLLHSTTKLYFFVIGLLLFGEAVKPVAAAIFLNMPPLAAFFGNAISAIADNALLGLLEIQHGMPQQTVLILGISLAFWGVGLVPGNVCNVVLKEKLQISFKHWALYGIPCAIGLAALNFALIVSGVTRLLMF